MGELLRSIKSGHKSNITIMSYDNSGTLLATGSNDGSVKVWDIARGYCTHHLQHDGLITSVKFLLPECSPGRSNFNYDENCPPKLFTGTQDGTLTCWSLLSSLPLYHLNNHMSAITSLSFAFGGKRLISGGRDQVLSFWNIEEEIDETRLGVNSRNNKVKKNKKPSKQESSYS